jgi:hypothetical protein
MRVNRFAALAGVAVLALSPSLGLAWKVVQAGVPFQHKASGYSVQFPDDWKWSKLWFSDESGATRDGPNLQAIFVDFRAHKNAFRATKKSSNEAMLPQEIAQLLIADMTKERGLDNVQILSNEPETVAGRPGFRLKITYKNPVMRGAVRFQEIICGALNAKGIYLVGYRAPVLYYFDKDESRFDVALQTFAIADQPKKK